MSKDRNDLGKDGVGLDDMVNAAESRAPIALEDAAAQESADKAILKSFKVLVESVSIAQDTQESVNIIADWSTQANMVALQAARFRHKDAVFQGLTRMKGARGLATVLKDFAHELRTAAPEVIPNDISRLTKIKGLRDPAGYRVMEDGVYLDGEAQERIAPAPLIIRAIAYETGTPVVRLQLAWKKHGRWHKHSLERHKALDARSLISMARYGCPVDSTTAANVVRFLARFEATNLSAIPAIQVATTMGWTKRDFLWGAKCLGLSGDLKLTGDDGLLAMSKGYRDRGS